MLLNIHKTAEILDAVLYMGNLSLLVRHLFLMQLQLINLDLNWEVVYYIHPLPNP